MRETGVHLCLKFVADFVLCFFLFMLLTRHPAVLAGLHSNWPSMRTKPTLLHLLRSVGASYSELFRATALPCTALDCMPMLLLLLMANPEINAIPTTREK
jgi:hypothetical protein